MAAYAELNITDGTTVVSLVNRASAFHLQEWLPSIITAKGGGVWQDSPLAEGRRMVDREFGNAVETLTLAVNAWSQNALARDTQNLRRLLEKAVQYWITDWQNEPVWIEARSHHETNKRYALIQDWQTPQDGDLYNQPVFHRILRSAMRDFTLILERGHWLANEPGDGACVETSGEQDTITGTNLPLSYPNLVADDCHASTPPNIITLNAAFHEMGNSAAVPVGVRDAGIRFRNVTVPQGATILSAYIRFHSATNEAVVAANVTIEGENSSTPAAFTTYADFYGRPRTATSTPWNAIPAWIQCSFYNSPDISGVVTEITSRGDWVSGNDLTIFLMNNVSTAGAKRSFTSFEGDVTRRAELHIQIAEVGGGSTFGRAETCTDEVYIANKQNLTNLTHIYVYDNPAWLAPNEVTSTAFNLLPGIPIIGDGIYFGIDSTFGWTGPFCSLVFDVNAMQVDCTIDWEYSTGVPGWQALVVQDNTAAGGIGAGQPFDTAGVGSVHFVQPTSPVWAPQTEGPGAGVNAYWVRANVSAVGAVPTGPTQQNRTVYSILWPRIDVDEAQVGGDVPAIADINIVSQSNYYGTTGAPDLYSNRVIMALRSMARGSNFTPYINLSDRQNPTGIDIDVTDAEVAFATDLAAPTGRRITFTGGGANGTVEVGLLPVIAWEWYGTFHVFLRAQQPSGSPGDTDVRLAFWFGKQISTIFRTDWVSFLSTNVWQILDFGRVTLPIRELLQSELITGETIAVGTASIQCQIELSGTQDVYLYDLILMPVDEWAGDFEDVDSDGYGYIGMHGPAADQRQRGYLEVDSITYPKQYLRALVRQYSNDYVMAMYQRVVNDSHFLLKENGDFRLWFLSMRRLLTTTTWQSEPEVAFSVKLEGTDRYFSMRGNR